MNANSIPEILKDKALFDTYAFQAANHVLKQPSYIQEPIAEYGACVETNTMPDKSVLVEFWRAMIRARMETWTNQLNDPLYQEDLGRLEDTIALNVYLNRRAIERLDS